MEIWKDVIGFEGLYKVSNFGRVKSLQRTCQTKHGTRGVPEKIITPTLKVYASVVLCNDTLRIDFNVHRLVALAFLPNPEGKRTVNHKNGNKLDNRLENLEWATDSENQKHAYDNGLSKSRNGEKCNLSKLTKHDVAIIRDMLLDGRTNKEISQTFNVNTETIRHIKVGKTWKNG